MSKKEHKTSIGGQALIEGVMMKGPDKTAVSVRKPDGEIVIKVEDNTKASKNKFCRLPIIRGCITFFESLIIGTKALMYSAEFMDLEEDEKTESKFDKWLERVLGDKIKDVVIYVSVIISLVFSIGLFVLLPNWVASLIKLVTANRIILNLCEGIIKITIFLTYLWAVSKMKDIKRVFEYHGAEHKTIACYEAGEELTPENAKKYCRLHPRCGTSFLFIVMIVSIACFSFLSWDVNVFIRSLSRILLMPVVSGISYEIIKYAGRHDNILTKILSAPGLWLQNITTNEPDEGQLEVAISSMKAVLTEDPKSDKW